MKPRPARLISLLIVCLLAAALPACDSPQPPGTGAGEAPLPTSQPRSGPPPAIIAAGSTYFAHLPDDPGGALPGFGRSIDASQATLVVGAAGPAGQLEPGGSAFIYHRTGLTWNEEAQLTARALSSPGVLFGYSVSVDAGRIAVGAPGTAHPQAGVSAGAVYIFEQRDGAWTETARLEAPAPASGAQFGSRVDLAGDLLAVGGGPGAGAVDIFQWIDGGWRPAARLSGAEQGLPQGAFFGASLSLSGERLAVGALPGTGAATSPGSVYLYQTGPNGWQPAGLVQGDTIGDSFGAAVALQGDLLAVGAPADPDGGRRAGAAYLFAYDGVEWLRLLKLLPADAGPLAAFGSAIALEGDLLAVGAPGSTSPALKRGAVYVFQQQGSTWADRLLLQPGEAGVLETFFGSGLSLHSGTLAVAAPGENGSAAYAYELAPP